MEQQRCTILSLYFNWTIFFAGATFFLITERYLLLAAWLVGAPVFQVAYVLAFPHLSHALGYGSVADEAATAPPHAPFNVTLYTAVGCPFCPIVEQRLESLKATMGFTLTKIDVTMRPDILGAKRIKGVPVVEAGGVRRTGSLTSRELAELIAAGSTPPARRRPA